MDAYLSFGGLLKAGGPTLIILFLCSLVSIIIIIERLIYFSQNTPDSHELIKNLLDHGKLDEALIASPLGYVLAECSPHRADGDMFEEVKSRAISEKLPEMERYLSIEATLGTVSPYIGLLGTVIGIIQAFSSLSTPGAEAATNMSGLNAGIAHALVATAGGLFVAIPATVAYNYFRKRVSQLLLEIEVAVSRLKTGSVPGRQSN